MLENRTVRAAIFGALVVALAVLAIWATLSRDADPTEPAAAAQPVETLAPQPGNEPTPEPTSDAEPEAPTALDGPLTSEQIAAASAVAREFLVAYSGFNATTSEREQLRLLQRMTASSAQFDPAPTVPSGLERERLVKEKITRTATADIEQITLTATDTAAFLATVTIEQTGGSRAGTSRERLTILMTRQGSAWKVLDLTLGDEFGAR